jgi:hypothetical protein
MEVYAHETLYEQGRDSESDDLAHRSISLAVDIFPVSAGGMLPRIEKITGVADGCQLLGDGLSSSNSSDLRSSVARQGCPFAGQICTWTNAGALPTLPGKQPNHARLLKHNDVNSEEMCR